MKTKGAAAMERANLDWKNLTFSYFKTDCHVKYYYRNGHWDEGRVDYDDIFQLNIASTCLHYSQQCFEGLKVFEGVNGEILVFRPEENAKRMMYSAEKILMPPVPPELFMDAVMRVVKLNSRFIPPYGSGASLYIRPLQIGISPIIGVKPSTEYLFLVLCTPVGPYFKSGLKPIKLLVEESLDRAAPNGLGDAKVGGNYAAGLRGTKKANDHGYTEVLYLDSAHKKYIDESGPANFLGITKDNVYVTPQSHSILKSITNLSLMQLARDMGLKVEQRPMHVDELFNLKEAGCCGTAAVISPVKSIDYHGKTITYCEDDRIGPVCQELYDRLTSIQLGKSDDIHGWTKKI
jgi:branched-chain amino acid aminotransferase